MSFERYVGRKAAIKPRDYNWSITIYISVESGGKTLPRMTVDATMKAGQNAVAFTGAWPAGLSPLDPQIKSKIARNPQQSSGNGYEYDGTYKGQPAVISIEWSGHTDGHTSTPWKIKVNAVMASGKKTAAVFSLPQGGAASALKFASGDHEVEAHMDSQMKASIAKSPEYGGIRGKDMSITWMGSQ